MYCQVILPTAFPEHTNQTKKCILFIFVSHFSSLKYSNDIDELSTNLWYGILSASSTCLQMAGAKS